jgi:hypothetical protein
LSFNVQAKHFYVSPCIHLEIEKKETNVSLWYRSYTLELNNMMNVDSIAPLYFLAQSLFVRIFLLGC